MNLPDVIEFNMEKLIEFDKCLQGEDRTEKMIRIIILRKIMLALEAKPTDRIIAL